MSTKNKLKHVGKNQQTCTIKRRRHWSVLEKLKIVEESKYSNATICSVAGKYNVAPSLLYYWRHLERKGKLKAFNAIEEVVPVSAVNRLKSHIHNLERLLEKKNKEIEILKVETSGKPIIHNLEKYPFLRMAIKYNLF